MLNRLAVIGFDAQLDGLENVDQVVAAFYKGKAPQGNSKQSISSSVTAKDLFTLSVSRIAQQHNFTQQQMIHIVVSEKSDQWTSDHKRVGNFVDALAMAETLIREANIAVLITCLDLTPSLTDSIATEAINAESTSVSFDSEFKGYNNTQGVVSILLSDETFAKTHQAYVYSYINGFAYTDDLSNLSASISTTIDDAFSDAQLQPQHITSLEVSALADPQLQLSEQNALLQSYTHHKTLHTSLSCVKSTIGESRQLSAFCGFLNCVVSLQLRYRSAISGWEKPQPALFSAWANSPFYVLNETTADFTDSTEICRTVAYSCLSDQRYAHIILQENNDHKHHRNGLNACSESSLFLLFGQTETELISQLMDLVELSQLPKTKLKTLAKQLFQARHLHNNTYRLVLIASSFAQLSAELNRALIGVPNAFATQQDWKTPQGSYFCVNRQVEPKTCFLYPGIGATYLGLGRELLQLFPDVYPSVEKLIRDSHAGIKDQLLNPRSISKLSFDEVKARDLALRRNLADIAECGVGYAYIFTRVFKDVLNINADFSAGYSMGEVSMFAALDCWQSPGKMSERLADSPTFNQQLSGELKVLESCWDLPESSRPRLPQACWESYNIKGDVAQVQAAIKADERVYITLINTPDSLVIAGFPDDCLAVAKRLGVRALALNVHNAIHSEPAYQEYDRMVDLYSMDIAGPVSTKLYSSSCYLPIPFNQKAIAVSIAKCLCEPVDFPRLIKTIKAAGASVFIEMGAGRSLCTWTDKIMVDEILGNKAHTVAINAKGTDLQQMIMRAVAKLISLGVDVNLKPFFEGSIIVNDNTVSKKTHSKANM